MRLLFNSKKEIKAELLSRSKKDLVKMIFRLSKKIKSKEEDIYFLKHPLQ